MSVQFCSMQLSEVGCPVFAIASRQIFIRVVGRSPGRLAILSPPFSSFRIAVRCSFLASDSEDPPELAATANGKCRQKGLEHRADLAKNGTRA